MRYVLALDQGTTGSTALMVSADGTIVGRGYREFPQHFPKPGWVEHDAEEIWNSTLVAAREALGQASVVPDAVGITNQRETVVAWDRTTGRPLYRALVWQDRRTTARCRELRETFGEAWLAERTGLLWDPYFSGTKIEWMLQHVPGLRARVQQGEAVFGTVDSWLAFRLTGGRAHVTDHTNASRTLLYDIRRHGWSEELCTTFGVPSSALPTIVPSSGVVGTTEPALFGAPIPVAGMAGDQQAALFGQGCWEAGQAKNTYGTGAFLLMNIGREVGKSGSRQVLTTIACDVRGEPVYALEGSVFVAGAAVQWLRDGLGLIAKAQETERLARAVEDTGGVYFVPALTGLGAPHWEPEARGTIVGLTRGTRTEHLVRAALEAMAYATKDMIDAMATASGVHLTDLKVDGGASANDWLMRFQASVLGVPVLRPDLVETTALGAAGLAGLAVGVWPDAPTFLGKRTYARFAPDDTLIVDHPAWARAVRAALSWARGK